MFGRKAQQRLITGIDIGSTAIRIALGQRVLREDGDFDLHILGLVEVPTEGVHKGNIVSLEETVSSLSHGLEQIERLTGVMVDSAWVGVSGTDILSQKSKGVVAVAKADGEISADDVSRVVDASRTVSVPLNYEILHVIPHSFGVDGQIGIKDPTGMTGIRLEADVQIIYGITQQIKHLTKAVYRTGIDIDDLVLSVLAVGDVVTTSRQRDLGVCVVNIGGSTTTVVVYEDGDIVHTAVLPIGSEYITNDIAIGLKADIDVAERIKIDYGHCVSKEIPKREKVDLSNVGASDGDVVSLKFISEIIEARTQEILEKINQELMKIDRAGRLPAGVVLTGGGAKISGIVELTKRELALPASLGYPMYVTGGQGNAHDISFSAALGLVKWGANMRTDVGKAYSKFNSSQKLIKNMQDIWKSLMP